MAPKAVEENLPRYFDLIKRVYSSNKWNASSKKQAILAYFFQQLDISKNEKTSLRYKLLWETFQGILDLENKSMFAHRVLIHSQASKILLEAVQNYPYSCSWASIILSSISTFSQTPSVNATLISDLETLLKLLIGTLKIIINIHKSNSDDLASLKESVYLANITLDILENLPSSNEEEKALVLSDSLQDVSTFMYISSGKEDLKNLSEKFTKKIVSIIFNLKNKEFETLLTLKPLSNEEEEPNASLLQFFSSMQNILLNEEVVFQSISANLTCATLMKTLLSNFLLHNSNLYSLKVMALFFAVAGIDIPIVIDASSCCKSLFKKFDNADESILGISHLLEACSTIPQYFVSMAVPDGYLKPSLWLRGISTALLTKRISKNKSAWLKCFQCLLTISPTLFENDILPLIKMALLNISVHSTESRKQYCELFNTIIQAHSQLHQIPKFFVKLLLALTECIKEDSGGKFITNGRILPEIQEAIARCVQELPHRQMIELWKMFIETFSTLEVMSKAFMTNKSFVFFVAQLFSTFLLHAQLFQANIPSNIFSQFISLINDTSAEIKKNVSALKDTDIKAIPLQKSVLLLSFAVGEVKLSYNAYYEKSVDSFNTELSEHAFDFSIIHDYLDKDYAAVLECYLSGDDKILSVLVFQLLLQKIKALQFQESMLKDVHMQMPISIVLQHLQKSSAIAPWDTDICMVSDKNYSTVLWAMFLKVFPLVLHNLNHKEIYSLCHSIQSIVLQDDCSDTGAKGIILSCLKSEFVQESKHFQTIFVSALWNRENLLLCKKRSYDDTGDHSTVEKMFSLLNAYHSKDVKYAQRTPKSNKNLGSMWDEVKEISDLLNNILLSELLPKDKLITNKTLGVVKLFNSLPLEYLLPGNQMKCIIGLSFLLFLVPQSCKSSEALILTKEISSVMVSIFEGVRSIWLFDFVTSGPYLKFVVKTLEAVIDESNEESDWAIQLIDHLISLIVRNVDSFSAIEQCISRLVDMNKSRTALITFYALFRKLSQILHRSLKQETYKNILLKISSVACLSFVKYMKRNFNKDSKNKDAMLFIKCYTQVIEITSCSSHEGYEHVRKECLELLSSTVEMAIAMVTTSEIDSLIDAYLLFISKACKHSSKISSSLPEKFVSVSWNIVLSHFEEKASKNKSSESTEENIKSPLPASKVKICSICSTPSFIDKNEENRDLPFGTLAPLSLNESEEASLRELFMITSIEELFEVFQRILHKMGCSSSFTVDVSQFQMFLLVYRCLIDNITDKSQKPLLIQSIQKCLSFLHTVMNQTCYSLVCQTMVSIPILDFMSFVLRGKEDLPKQLLYQSLHCVIAVPVDVLDNNYDLYAMLFTAAWNVVYDLFMHHTSLILASPAPFLACVSKLLKSIVKAGATVNLSKCSAGTFQQVQLCAQNINRLLTVISRNKKEFSKLVPYLVADYVNTVQHVTLESSIKDSVISGIYRLLDLCAEDSIRMLAVNINYIGREIYSNLVKHYKLNKYTGAT